VRGSFRSGMDKVMQEMTKEDVKVKDICPAVLSV
jgi:hypothetical protein